MKVSVILRVLGGLLLPASCIRIDEAADESYSEKAESSMTSTRDCGTCPCLVSEDSDGFCLDADTRQEVSYYCCNALRSCRASSTELLEYYLHWLGVYQSACGITDTDFRVTSNGQHLTLKSNEKICGEDAATCRVNRELQEKPEAPSSTTILVEDCRNRVEDQFWLPQLDSAIWPQDQVNDLDDAWESCTTRVTPEPTPAPTVPSPLFPTPAPEPPPETPVDTGVDMSFMTSDFAPPVRQGGIWSWFNRIFMRKRVLSDNTKETITNGHVCKNRGTEAQTYFASSMCYWLPEKVAADGILGEATPITLSNTDTTRSGLEWNGHRPASPYEAPADGSLCNYGNYLGEGQCVKCSICHDNAMNEEGRVTATEFFEEIALRTTGSNRCLKEKEIEQRCLDEYHLLNADLTDDVRNCRNKERVFVQADQEYRQADLMLTQLRTLVDTQLPAQIADEQAELDYQSKRLEEASIDDEAARQDVHAECADYVNYAGRPFWYFQVTNRDAQGNWVMPTEELLRDMNFVCIRPTRPIDDGTPGYSERWASYESRQRIFEFCQLCDGARTRLSVAYEALADATDKHAIASDNMDVLQETLTRKSEERNDLETRVPVLQTKRDQLADDWENNDPTRADCEIKVSDYTTMLRSQMRTCVPSFYDRSCEKECVDQQIRNEGCGVMEGNLPTDITGRGGVRAVCNPPQASWVTAPFSYNAQAESPFDQCRRIFLKQYPIHAQTVLKYGWLHKRGRDWGWDRRFFVLEAGDQVRSGILRYFLQDPSVQRGAVERFQKTTILWDAERVSSKPPGHYGWNDGSLCFKIVTFYRHMRLCVPGETPGNVTAHRNEWVVHLTSQLGANRYVPSSGYR